MMVVPWKRTMAGAKRLVEPKTPTPRRDRVIALAQRWNREHPREMKPRRRKPIVIHKRVNIPILPYTSPITIIQQVAFWHGVSVNEVMSDSRLIPIVEARFDAIAAVRINCRIAGRRPGLMDLARQFKRDHTTIISALRQRGLRG
jgi:hypothetical protein